MFVLVGVNDAVFVNEARHTTCDCRSISRSLSAGRRWGTSLECSLSY